MRPLLCPLTLVPPGNCLQKSAALYNIQLAKQLHGLEHHKVIWVKPSDIKARHFCCLYGQHMFPHLPMWLPFKRPGQHLVGSGLGQAAACSTAPYPSLDGQLDSPCSL